MRNGEIAEAFEELASLYELDGAVVYRVVAYRNAAKAIREAGVSVAEMAKQGRAEELAGVGKTIAEKIDALLGDRLDPLGRQAEAAHPVRPGRGHPHPRPRPEARQAAPRRAGRQLDRGPPPRGGERPAEGREGLRQEGRGERAGRVRRRRRRTPQGADDPVEGAPGWRGARRRPPRPPRRHPRGAGRERAAPRRHREGPRHRGLVERPGRARRGVHGPGGDRHRVRRSARPAPRS